MARIIDKDTRLIDIDFGPVQLDCTRNVTLSPWNAPTTVYAQGNGADQLLWLSDPTDGIPGSFIQYQRLDLEFMTMNNEVMVPVEVDIQRTSPTPLGYNNNGNTFDTIEEFVFILSRPLNNTELSNSGDQCLDAFRQMGLDRAEYTPTVISGVDAGYPSQAQTIYAEKRSYAYTPNSGATIINGQILPLSDQAADEENKFYQLYGMPILQDVSTWGSLSAITGPNLHCYRVLINRTQSFPGISDLFLAQFHDGSSQLKFPPVNIRFLCKDPNFSEGEYLTRIANAMNSTPEGGPTHDR
jgi:hypothetical protein